jgi:hypothetical protein
VSKALPLGAVALLALAGMAQARKPVPQQHELRLDVDISIENEANTAIVDFQYIFTPKSLNRFDEVVPALRRYVRHPSALWLRATRFGSSLDATTSAKVGGIGQLLDGKFFTLAEVGIEYDDVLYDLAEDSYLAMPFTLELGGRPAELISLGAYYRGRPILAAYEGDTPNKVLRSGNEHSVGGLLSFATPDDRLFVSLGAGYHLADWEFTGFHAGTMTVRGLQAMLSASFQTSEATSVRLNVVGARENWVNERVGDEDVIFVGPDLDRDVWSVRGELEMMYWYQGRIGLRVGLGGGYEGEKPIFRPRERGQFRLGFGIVTRY